jgi:uncharacterized protein YjiK
VSIEIFEIASKSNPDYCLAISGIVYSNGNLALVSENSGKIFEIDPSTKKTKQEYKIPFEDIELEAITYFKGAYYITDEKNGMVYKLGTTKNETPPIKVTVTSFDVSIDPKGNGLEWIAVNEEKELFYLLMERDETAKYAKILLAKLNAKNELASLTGDNLPQSTFLLDISGEWRYSDLFYSEKDSCIYALKTKKESYNIMKIKVDANGIPLSSQKDSNNIIKATLFIDITDEVIQKEKEGYNSNIEGITQDGGGNIFIVSDNVWKGKCKGKTLLLKIPSPK